jgi:ComF family protein
VATGTFGALESLLALVYPNVCQICKEGYALQDGYVCARCERKDVGFIEPPFCGCCGLPFEGEITTEFVCANCHDVRLHFRAARSAVEFSGAVKEAIHGYKYNHAIWFEAFLVKLLAKEAVPVLAREKWDWIVPIPLHWLKRLERSFNQAERLAKALSRATGIPVNGKLVRRARRTEVQARLSRSERAENVKGAFAYRGRVPLEGARIVLIDDVMTTGATASACAKVLVQNGAEVVDVWTVARNVLK